MGWDMENEKENENGKVQRRAPKAEHERETELGMDEGQLGRGPEEDGAEGEFRSAEVAAFLERLSYFRKPTKIWREDLQEWREWNWYAGDRTVQDALDGKKTIGLRASWTTSFISFDIDVPGKLEKAKDGKESGQDEEEAEDGGGEEGRKSGGADRAEREWKCDDKRSDEERAEDRARDERMSAEIAAWAGWDMLKERDDGSGEFLEELGRAMAAIEEVKVPEGKIAEPVTMELSLELRQAAEIIKSCFTVEPSLAVRSPHGCHLFWCLSEKKYWPGVREIATKVKEEVEDQYREKGIERTVEVLPSPTQGLRVPRKDRLLMPGSLERMEEPKDGEAFWKGLRQYRLEESVKENILERKIGEHRKVPYRGPKRGRKREPDEEMTEEEKEELRERVTGRWRGTNADGLSEEAENAGELVGRIAETGGTGAEGGEDGDGEEGDGSAGYEEREGRHGWRKGRKPQNREEAERDLMPFRNGETNDQLIAMVEAGKRSRMTVAEIVVWVNEWIGRSREEGYAGDLGKDERQLESRIDRLYARCNVKEGGKERWAELWESENGKYARDEEGAGRMLAELEKVETIAKQSKASVLKFIEEVDVWRRIVDDEAGREPSRLDGLTVENQKRGAYPYPKALLRRLRGNYAHVWDLIQRAGVIIKDTEAKGRAVPMKGQVQYYSINY